MEGIGAYTIGLATAPAPAADADTVPCPLSRLVPRDSDVVDNGKGIPRFGVSVRDRLGRGEMDADVWRDNAVPLISTTPPPLVRIDTDTGGNACPCI